MSPFGIAAIAGAGVIGYAFWKITQGGVGLPRRSPGPGRTAVIGDSIVAHQHGFVRYLDQNVPGRSFTNFGIVGQGTAAIRRDLQTRVIGQGFDEVVVEGGLNDAGRENALDYIIGNLRAMVQEAKAAGLKVVLVTMTPYYANKALVAQGNAIILRDGRSWGADAVVDTHSAVRSLNNELRSDLAAPDRLHLNRTGQEVIGQTILSRAYA